MPINREERITCVWRTRLLGEDVSIIFHDASPSLLVLGRLIDELQEEQHEERRRAMEERGRDG